MRAQTLATLLGISVAMSAGCLSVLGVEDSYTLGTAGSGAGAGGSGGSGAEGGQGGTGAQGGSTGECNLPADCPGSDTSCTYRTCTNHTCGMSDAPEGTDCTEPPGANVCDGAGECVECTDAAGCSGSDTCIEGACYAEHCSNDTQDGGETDLNCGGPECPPCPNGDGCNVYTDCQSGFCDNGTCQPCDNSFDCDAPQSHCDSGSCVDDVPNGEPCNYDTWCLSDNCQSDENICCDEGCQGDCESCLEANTGEPDGTCAPILSGSGSCQQLGCLGNSSEVTVAGSCNGTSSNCVGEVVISCSPYDCNSSTDHCYTSCTNTSQCNGNYYCNGSNQCVPKKDNGDSCTEDNQCDSDICQNDDNVCCNSGCSGLCQACVASKTGGTDGICSSITAGTDPDGECQTPTPNCSGSNSCI